MTINVHVIAASAVDPDGASILGHGSGNNSAE
eukprot:CAMPEP_0114004550 /NCGR_PEP_ID=MMETSP0372-20130328/2710_1 /TAXON_ID=340204 /ORGANISM="Lankesteria abbotti" /LENGTH=31 /assembly_acc=CAM_ASM_000359